MFLLRQIILRRKKVQEIFYFIYLPRSEFKINVWKEINEQWENTLFTWKLDNKKV